MSVWDRPKLKRLVTVAVLISACAGGARSHASITAQFIAGGFSSPLHVTAPPGDTDRLFVVERGGRIRIIDLDTSTVLGTPFLDVNDSPNSNVDQTGEGGLLSMAFHPDYGSNGFFFVYYTADINPGPSYVFGTRVSRFTVSSNPNVANPASEVVFYELAQPATNHNGGMIAFRPGDANNYLYIGLGDGGGACDSTERAQNINSQLGKMLRIEVDIGPISPGVPNAPPSNPFVGVAGDDLIWSLGLRNPYRFSFDRVTGDMYIGDVGQGAREEISFEANSSSGGLNFGWDAYEGFLTPPPGCGVVAPTLPEMVPPLHDYDRADGQAVTGGHVYRGLDYNSMAGRYFFADFSFGNIWSFVRNGNGITDLQNHTSALNPSAANVSGFGEDGRGELYFTTFNGNVIQIVDPASSPVDTDQDLLPDAVESDTGIFVDENDTGTDPFDPDTDDDGVRDGIEVQLGYNPLDDQDFPLLPLLRYWVSAAVLATVLIGSAVWIRRRELGPLN